MLLLAPALQNPLQPLIRNAALWIEGDVLQFVGAEKDLPVAAREDAERLEIKDTLLLPGMINAHAHLELSHLSGLAYPGGFVAWIKAVLSAKNNPQLGLAKDPFAQGIAQSLWGGTTTVGDHVSVTSPVEALMGSPFRGKAFLEVLGVVPEVAQDIYRTALDLKEHYQKFSRRWDILPSPHSVHALDPEVLAEVLSLDQSLFSIHLAESEAEALYFREKKGEMHDLIASRGTVLQREGASSIQELSRLGRLDSRILAIHANYLDDADLELLQQANCSIVHCPLSHRYFAHRAFRMKDCLDAGINIALGTDSLASAHSLSMLDILRSTKGAFPFLSQEQIFAMATLGGAKALKMENQVGELAPSKKADVVGVPWRENLGAHENLFASEKVSFSMIGGKVLIGLHADFGIIFDSKLRRMRALQEASRESFSPIAY